MKDLGICINWYGPYDSLSTAGIIVRRDFLDGLYLAIGNTSEKVTQGRATLLYIGGSSNLGQRVTPAHETLRYVTVRGIWLGEITSHIPSGKRSKIWNAGLDTAENCLIYFTIPALNKKRLAALPKRSFMVVNRWYETDYETESRRPHGRCPEIIDYSAYDRRATLVWTGADAKVEQVTN